MPPVARELLPLPVEGCLRKVGREASSRQARCVRQRRGLGKHIDEVCCSVNALSVARAGHSLRRGQWPQLTSATEDQLAVRAHFGKAIRQLGPPPSSAGALSELLKSRDVYDLDRQVSMRPYEAHKVRAVREGTVPKDIMQSSLLQGEAKVAAQQPFRHILKSDEEIEAMDPSSFIIPYTDPVLRRRGEMESLVKKLAATGFLTFRKIARSKVGVFCVAKKDDQLRLILDCRATNALCKPPPTTELATPNAFANLDLRDPYSAEVLAESRQPGMLPPAGFGDMPWIADDVFSEVENSDVSPSPDAAPESASGDDDSTLLFSGLDLTDAFYQLGWEGMSSYFCLDIAVRAGDFDFTSVYDEVTGKTTQLHEDDKVFPALAVLPMGLSWSLLFCHSLLTEAMLESSARVGGGSRDDYRGRLLRDRRQAPRLSRTAPILAPYVDNGNPICRWTSSGCLVSSCSDAGAGRGEDDVPRCRGGAAHSGISWVGSAWTGARGAQQAWPCLAPLLCR